MNWSMVAIVEFSATLLSYDDTVTFPVLRKITDTMFYRIHADS